VAFVWEGQAAFSNRLRTLAPGQYEIAEVRTKRGITRALLFPRENGQSGRRPRRCAKLLPLSASGCGQGGRREKSAGRKLMLSIRVCCISHIRGTTHAGRRTPLLACRGQSTLVSRLRIFFVLVRGRTAFDLARESPPCFSHLQQSCLLGGI
jgi:hypothetical protein